MTEHHNHLQKCVGALRGGRNDQANIRSLSSSLNHPRRLSGGSKQLPPLPPPPVANKSSLMEQTIQQKENKAPDALNIYRKNYILYLKSENHTMLVNDSRFSSMVIAAWQKEPSVVKEYYEKIAAEISKQQKNLRVPISTNNGSELVDHKIFVSDEQLDFALYRNSDDHHSVAPLTPISIPSTPAEPTLPLFDSFDSDEEIDYDTVNFFPSLDSIGRRPLPTSKK
ncbi:10059_t:CDS:2 [Funneliformis geosporum]|uniref:15214_t:CDS:1 n=1 Tax=Funneliformis geosporum TaxID=1117311 RepID=A0A9W4SMI4_9GLOM|nr:15214_t:CDS:2 [Funneliformis geosporum]CAI2189690.1 10059_t:CDS:2 [Funneliformis geosporum]